MSSAVATLACVTAAAATATREEWMDGNPMQQGRQLKPYTTIPRSIVE